MEEQKVTKKSKIKKYLKWIVVCLFFVGVGFGVSSLVATDYIYEDYETTSYVDPSCNVAGIMIHGNLVTYGFEETDDPYYIDSTSSDYIVWQIEEANKNDNIKYVLIEVDSAGGSPVAGEEIEKAIKHSVKPVMAFIRDIGASASYLAVSSADKIWASEFSDVGSIGVTMSYLSEVELNKKEGYQFIELNSAKFKDSGSADKILTNEEKELFMRDLKIMHDKFVKKVSENRNIPLADVEKLADGSTVLGEEAKKLGLIDEVGGIYEVEKYLEEQLREKPNICWE